MTLDLAHVGDRCGNGFAPCQHPTLCSCGEALKAQGIARATEAASPDDRSRIDAAIRTVAARGVVFSANDVRPLIVGAHGPLVGARFNAAAKAGVIVHVGYEKSSKANTHAHPIAQWRAA
jgi:hypothetical protein